MEIKVVEATSDHASYVASNLTPGTEHELKCHYGEDIHTVVQKSVEVAKEAYTIIIDGNIIAIIGYSLSSLLEDRAHPWVLPTNNVNNYRKLFFRSSKRWIDHLITRFSVLDNVIEAGNTHGVQLLKWIGFTVYPAVSNDSGPARFHYYRMERS